MNETEFDSLAATTVDDDDAGYWLAFTPPDPLFYVPKIAAVLSMMGSYCIIREVCVDIRRHKSSVINRVLLSMSIADILFSFGWFLTAWPAPAELTYLKGTNHGNQQTCTAQGFILEIGGAASAYFYAFISICYLLVVKYNWKEPRLQILEKWGTVGLWLLASCGALVPIFLDMYNFSWYVCWIQAHPLGCSESWQVGHKESTCTRGDNAFLYSIIVQVIPRWVCFFTCVVMMILIFCATRKLERSVSRYGPNSLDLDDLEEVQDDHYLSSPSSTHQGLERSNRSQHQHQQPQTQTQRRPVPVTINRKRSKAVAVQGMLYCFVILLSFSADLISYMLSTAAGVWNETFDTIAYFLTPLAGFLYFMIFSRTRTMNTPEGRLLRKLICFPAHLRICRPCERMLFFLSSSSSSNAQQAVSSSEETRRNLDDDRNSKRSDLVIPTSEWIQCSRDETLNVEAPRHQNTTEFMQPSETTEVEEAHDSFNRVNEDDGDQAMETV